MLAAIARPGNSLRGYWPPPEAFSRCAAPFIGGADETGIERFLGRSAVRCVRRCVPDRFEQLSHGQRGAYGSGVLSEYRRRAARAARSRLGAAVILRFERTGVAPALAAACDRDGWRVRVRRTAPTTRFGGRERRPDHRRCSGRA